MKLLIQPGIPAFGIALRTVTAWTILLALSSFAFASQAAVAQTLTALHTFSGPDEQDPLTGLTLDKAGNLYGTTYYGGSDGFGPNGSLVLDADGNIYGTTEVGGSGNFGDGVVYRITQ